jgi:hypothetical protein
MYNMEAPGDAVRWVLEHSDRIAGDRETGTDWNAAVAVEEVQPVDDADVQCSRVLVAGDGAEVVAPVAYGGWDDVGKVKYRCRTVQSGKSRVRYDRIRW